jgi:hypothetical protein
MIDGTSALKYDFEYRDDIDPVSGAPTIVAIPKTAQAALLNIPYNVINDFEALFERDNLREAWRVMRKNDPFDYQLEVADAILYSCITHKGWFFVVMITRQAGKNEISAFIQQYLLVRGWYFGEPTSGVKFAPVFKPQVQVSMDRLEGADTPDSGGLAGSCVTKGRFRKADGYKYHMGKPRDTNKWAFLSIDPTANVAGQTALTLLEGDEAQDIDGQKWERDAQPMTSFNAATTVLWGVAWTKESFIYTGLQQAHNLEEVVEAEEGVRPKLVFKIDAYRVIAAGNKNYEKAFRNQVARLGIDHIAIQTQYLLNFVDSIGRFFSNEQIARMYNNPFRMRVGPEPGKRYVFSLDAAGQEEKPTNIEDIEVGKHKRDGLALIIGELMPDRTVVPVCLYQFVGQAHSETRKAILSILKHWGIIGGCCDATGVGEALAFYLKEKLPHAEIEAYKFKASGDENKSKLGYTAYAAVMGDQIKVPRRPVTDPQQAELWDELKYQVEQLIREAKKEQKINWYVPSNAQPRKPGHTPHDDLVCALFLLIRAVQFITNPAKRQAGSFDRGIM